MRSRSSFSFSYLRSIPLWLVFRGIPVGCVLGAPVQRGRGIFSMNAAAQLIVLRFYGGSGFGSVDRAINEGSTFTPILNHLMAIHLLKDPLPTGHPGGR